MARIAGIDLPRNKRLEVALTYIYGLGRASARKILTQAGVDFDLKTDNVSDADISKIREIMDREFIVEGDRRREVTMAIKRLVDLSCYRGIRHRKKLPVRGQRTSSNARTRKGKAVAIAGKKSIKQMK